MRRVRPGWKKKIKFHLDSKDFGFIIVVASFTSGVSFITVHIAYAITSNLA